MSVATHNYPNDPTGQRADKAFKTMAATLVLQGHALTRGNPSDGHVTYCVTRWGHVRHLPTLDDVKAFVYQIGGHDAQ
jgi:hypothetical protein